MSKKRHIKKGDTVYVLSGEESGNSGTVIEVFPKTERIVVEGLNMIKKHVRKNQDQPQGEIIEREGTIHWSNVMQEERYLKHHAATAPADAAEDSAETSTETKE